MKKSSQELQRIINTFDNHIIRDHQVIYRRGTPYTEIMTWGDKNGSSNCRIDYMLRNGSLCIYGDLGSAVYRWYNDKLTLEWIASCNMGYFYGKNEAGELGARGTDWDEDEAIKEVRDNVRQSLLNGSMDIDYYKTNEDAKNELRECLRSCEDRYELINYFRNGNPEIAFNDCDCWEWLPNVGNVMPMRPRMHLIGLKLAFGVKVDEFC